MSPPIIVNTVQPARSVPYLWGKVLCFLGIHGAKTFRNYLYDYNPWRYVTWEGSRPARVEPGFKQIVGCLFICDRCDGRIEDYYV
jgi:hypothetical protein